ncbi:MAG: class I SAM-dependent methyltransferase [Bellilinea sp.]
MDSLTFQHLLHLNQEFYQKFGPAFAATRRRIQPGVRRVVNGLPVGGRLLDLGCGSGTLALELDKLWITGSYFGLDFSNELLAEARNALHRAKPGGVDIRFARADLIDPNWADLAASFSVDVVLAFAVLHHIPDSAVRARILRQVCDLLPEGGVFIHSEWQFQHSAKLMARRVAWETVGIDETELEPGDTLLDWRYALSGQPEQVGLRYVHLFTREELAELAAQAGFAVDSEFESDGDGGRLGLYQAWRKMES